MVTYGIVRAWARPWIATLAKQGIGSNAIIRTLRQMRMEQTGSSELYRNKVMLQDIRQTTGLYKNEKFIRSLPVESFIPKHLLTETQLRQAHPYLVYGKMEVHNELTGLTETRNIAFYSDEYSSKQAWADEFIDRYPDLKYQEEETILSIAVLNAMHDERFPY